MNEDIERIPEEMFAFVRAEESPRDAAPETRSRGYLSDAFARFKKNKSSLAAAFIIAVLVLFAIISPMLSPYSVDDKDSVYTSFPPYVPSASRAGVLDGGIVRRSLNDLALEKLRGIAEETHLNPLIEIQDTRVSELRRRGRRYTQRTYTARVNRYFEVGVVYRVFQIDEFNAIQDWQDETGIHVIYPYTKRDARERVSNSNVWYKVSDRRGTPLLDSAGQFIPSYETNKSLEGAPYDSLRIPGDDGSYIYSVRRSGAVECRVCYYNYYVYLNGHEARYFFGTNSMGQDLFAALGTGARFSLLFALLVSVINLAIGAVYGAIQGYYGGAVDLVMDRISDILSGIPFVVCATLFQLHLAQRVGIVPSFLFAYVLTGWQGMASLTRKQFYRFKGQEFVLASRTLGASDARLMVRHIFPNAIGTIITSCALVIPSVISTETQLTYLGIINLEEFAGTSIGTLMSQGQAAMMTAPHAVFWPGLFVSLLLISFNLFGNGLRDAFNPSTRGAED